MATKTIKGEVITPPEIEKTKTGKTHTDFAIEAEDGKRYDATIWSSVCDQDTGAIAEGNSYLFGGFVGEDGGFVVKWFRENLQGRERSSKEQIVLDCADYTPTKRMQERTEPLPSWINGPRGDAIYREFMRDRTREQEALGKRRVLVSGCWRWQKEEHCIQIKGDWHDQIEFLLDQLGAHEVSKYYKEYRATHDMGGSLYQASEDNAWVEEYKEFKKFLVDLAKKKFEVPV